MRSLEPITIRSGAWETLQDAVSDVRRTVFVKEQGILPENEFDDTDPVCTHFAAFDDAGRPVGCARLLPDGHIGRPETAARPRHGTVDFGNRPHLRPESRFFPGNPQCTDASPRVLRNFGIHGLRRTFCRVRHSSHHDEPVAYLMQATPVEHQ